MIIFDTETTGLLLPGLVPLDEQPRMIEFAGIKLDDITLEELERLTFLCNPGIPISAEITKITRLTDADLVDAGGFASHYHELTEFFLGERTMVAHNLDFDRTILRHDLTRIGKEFAFPWPPNQICTVEASFSISNKRLKLGVLHELATGHGFEDAHRAMADTEALVQCVKFLISRGDM